MRTANKLYAALSVGVALGALLIAWPVAQAQTTVTDLAAASTATTVAAAALTVPEPPPGAAQASVALVQPPAGPGAQSPGKQGSNPEEEDLDGKKFLARSRRLSRSCRAGKSI